MLKKAGHAATIHYTFDRREGLAGAAFVITQLRVGGLDAREKDERIPLKYGMIGQETTGAGGFFKALRTIPVIVDICRDMEEVCPDAWLINFTNPAGIVTEAVLKYTKVRCIGLCNVPINMRHDAAERLSLPADKLDCRFIGLNHLSVMTQAFYEGKTESARHFWRIPRRALSRISKKMTVWMIWQESLAACFLRICSIFILKKHP